MRGGAVSRSRSISAGVKPWWAWLTGSLRPDQGAVKAPASWRAEADRADGVGRDVGGHWRPGLQVGRSLDDVAYAGLTIQAKLKLTAGVSRRAEQRGGHSSNLHPGHSDGGGLVGARRRIDAPKSIIIIRHI